MKQISQCLSNQGAPSETSESPPRGPSLPATRSTQSPAPVTEALRPASAKEMALVLNDLISMYGVPAGWDTSARLYRELWGALPADVLQDAVLAHMATPGRGEWFPKPADVLGHAQAEMDARYASRRRERSQARLEAPRRPRVTERDIEELWAKYGGRPKAAAVANRAPVRPAYVVDKVPETVRGKPWRE